MKRILVILICLFLPTFSFCQNTMNTAFDTNGPVGELLFDQNENGEIIYTGIVETHFSADTILGLAREYLYTLEKRYNVSTSNLFEGVTKVACDVEIPVGKRTISVGVMGSNDNIGKWVKPASTVSFNLVIDIRPGKYRYTLTNFVTDRWRIRGEGKDNGQSNMIHWQRYNSLIKLYGRSILKENSEYKYLIDAEENAYKDEHKAVMDFIEGLKTMAQISDDF